MTVKIKKLVWECAPFKDGTECYDKQFGFYINERLDEDPEFRFSACWGEGEPEDFPTMQEAKDWCQGELERFVLSMIDNA